MDKIYIPMSSLNFNNIITTESISPKSFYQNRKFGYKRFYNVKPNPFENILLGYSKLPNFSIEDIDLDNYPIVIEISVDLLPEGQYKKEREESIEIYKIFNTIYFHPAKTKFYFFSEKEKNICLIKLDPSIETKLLPIYYHNIKIIDTNNIYHWNENILRDIVDEQKDITDNDLYINRLKGFYYCYYLGTVLTKIKNQNLSKEYPIEEIKKLLLSAKENGLSDKFIEDFGKSFNNSQKANEKYKKFNTHFIIDINNYKIINFQDNILDKDNNEIYRNIINDLITYPIYNTQSFLDEKFNLVLKIGENFKEIFSSKWEGSREQYYINSLLDNLENYQPFDFKNIENEILKAISLFIFKGDDIEKLYNALQKENIKDYRLAFGLWGALFGFSALPKTISNVLFEEKTQNFTNIQDFLKDIYQKIHNFNIQESIKIDFIKEKIFNSQIKKQNLQKNKFHHQIQSSNEIPKCPICGADMVLKKPKPNDRWKKPFYGCSNYKATGCKGSRDLNFKDNSSKVNRQQKSNHSIIDIYEEIKNNGGNMNVTKARKLEKIKTNKEFKDKYQNDNNDNRFEFYKDKNTEMIRIK